MITRIQALYFKGFKYLDVRLRDYNILIGPNASGKSSLLDIFTFIKDTLEDGPDNAVKKRSSRFEELIWKRKKNYFELALEMEIPDGNKKKYKFARYELAISYNEKRGIIIENEALWLIKDKKDIWENQRKQRPFPLFPDEMPDTDHIIKQFKRTPPGWRKIVSKSDKGNDFFRSETTEWNIIYRFGPQKASLARIPEDENRFSLALRIKELLMEGIQYIQLNSVAMKWPCRPDASVSFEFDGSNLPKVVKHLKENYPESFNKWVEHVKTALPDIEKIEVKERPEDRYLYLVIHYQNNIVVSSWLLSDGTLRLLAQTIIAYLPEKHKVYIIEEPENGLHPQAIETVIQSLSSAYENQVILATHSPVILRMSQPKDILCFAKTSTGTIDVIRGEDHPKLKTWQKSVDLSTLHAAGVLQ